MEVGPARPYSVRHLLSQSYSFEEAWTNETRWIAKIFNPVYLFSISFRFYLAALEEVNGAPGPGPGPAAPKHQLVINPGSILHIRDDPELESHSSTQSPACYSNIYTYSAPLHQRQYAAFNEKTAQLQFSVSS